MSMNKRAIGSAWEEAVACYLSQAGVSILARNYRCSQGEIDLIGYHRDCLVFFEVKYRKNELYGKPEEAVNIRKQENICRCALVYLHCHGGMERAVRFDVVAVCGEQIRWYQNAFPFRRGKRRWN